MTGLFRALAIVIAMAGVFDPEMVVSRPEPVPVDFQTQPSTSAQAVRDRIVHALGNIVEVNTGKPAKAVVVVGQPADLVAPETGVPASIVSLVPSNARNVRLLAASVPESLLVNQELIVTATYQAVGMSGESSTFTLEQNGVEVASAEHRWTTGRERYTVTLRYAPPRAGLSKLTVIALPRPAEASDEDNAADLSVVATARPLRVAIYEPRPSWAAGFVRRALEADPIFEIAAMVRPSRDTSITAGARLPTLSAEGLAPYEVLIVGAPEELTTREVAALSAFCETRGGAVIFLPDRQPSGPYAQLVSAAGFDEVLLEKPISLAGDVSALRASELVVPREPGTAVAIASTPSTPARMVISSQVRGRGRLVFSGALDAWRFRSTAGDAAPFDRFWTGIVANLAFSAPHRAAVSVSPAIAAPGERLTLRVEVDPRLATVGAGSRASTVEASLIESDGPRQFVRLWPGAAPGRLEGEAVAGPSGRYDARAKIGEDMVDTPVMIAAAIRHPPRYDDETLEMMAATTGGVVVDAVDTGGLERHIRGLSHAEPHRVHPMRSAWWSVPFAALLCGEWAVRRKRGAR